MKTLVIIVMVLATSAPAEHEHRQTASKRIEIVAEPARGMMSKRSNDLGHEFLKLLDKMASFPTVNNWTKNMLTRYVSSGTMGHTVHIYGVLDDGRQIVILQMAQDIVNQGKFGRVYIEFRDAEKFLDLGDGVVTRSGEKTLRSRILRKIEQ